MAEELFSEIKRYMGFDKEDARALAGLLEPLRPALPRVVDSFYATLNQHERARAVLQASPGRLERLRISLLQWLAELFGGIYDHAYFERRCIIGRVHVQVQLPQHYMFTAMSVIRLSLMEEIQKLKTPVSPRAIGALHKLLDLELAIMNQTYREDLVRGVQELEHAQYEERISESQHLAMIGQLAASLAHEIKNPLAGISGAIQVLGAGLHPTHPHKEIIEEALRQIDRLDAAVKDLLIYARPKAPQFSPFDLNDIVVKTLALLREAPGFRTLKVQCDGTDSPHVVEADESQIQQVFTNIVLNAAHACEGGGAVHVRLESQDSYERIVVDDNGVGMSPEVLSKAFEPFFTTKARGTGLGLSICKRIIDAHRGALEIDSVVGRGTHVLLKIPVKS